MEAMFSEPLWERRISHCTLKFTPANGSIVPFGNMKQITA